MFAAGGLEHDHWTLAPGILEDVDQWIGAAGPAPSKGLVRRYQSDLEARALEHQGTFDVGTAFMGLAFDSSIGVFFNRDLAYAMASSAEASASETLPETFQYWYMESAVQRLTQCWDYLFQYLVQHCRLHDLVMPSRGSRDDLVTLAGWDQDFEEMDDGVIRIAERRKPLKRALADMKAQQRNLDYVRTGKRADQFFKAMKRQYAAAWWVDELRSLARHPATRQVREIRDHMTHVETLSAPVGIMEPLRGGGLPRPGLRQGDPSGRS